METAIRDLAEQQEALKNIGTNWPDLGNVGVNIKPGGMGASIKALTVEIVGLKQSFHPIPTLVKIPGSLERLDALERFNHTGFDAADLCLFPSIAIPPIFKLSTFDKYRGTSCPRSHLTMYCRKMTLHTHDDTLLIHFFQESLTGVTLRWYL
ncbi:hypothetical protein CR513_53489, partial [Mucuna pruriens]